MKNPKDKPEDFAQAPSDESRPKDVHIEAPTGLDLHPEPPKAVRIGRRNSTALLGIGIVLLLAFAYSGTRRTKRAQIAALESNMPITVDAIEQGKPYRRDLSLVCNVSG